jgi:DNA polymerase/3'-5' exonuclease PolX
MKKIEIARALAAAREALGAEAAAAGSAELDALLELPGLGRRRARQLYGELGVTTLEELAAALLDGRAHALPGFGADACERLRADLQQHFARSSRLGLAEAEAAAAPLLTHLRDAPGVERVEVAGSVRRRCPTVGDIDLLIVSSRPAQVIRHFVGTPETARVAAMDASRASIVLRSGLRADVRVVPRRCFGATLQFLTGSPTHNAEYVSAAWSMASVSASTASSAWTARGRAPGGPAASARTTSTSRSGFSGSRPSCARVTARWNAHRCSGCPSS